MYIYYVILNKAIIYQVKTIKYVLMYVDFSFPLALRLR